MGVKIPLIRSNRWHAGAVVAAMLFHIFALAAHEVRKLTFKLALKAETLRGGPGTR